MALATKLKHRSIGLFIIGIILFISIEPAVAQLSETQETEVQTLWLIIAGSLVFFMNAGFAMLEAGLYQTKNPTNVLAKNLIVFCISILAFWILGFGLMFGDGNSFIGATGFFFKAFDPPLHNSFNSGFDSLGVIYPEQPWIVVFFFQMGFAGTTATIVSGAMAERVKFWAFFWFSFLLIAIAYPITARWAWNPDGWLASLNFLDFAGSTVVHSVGGMAGLVGTILIGPRRGWLGYNPDLDRDNRFGDPFKSFAYHNLSLSTLGCLILWLGWIGFNGGSARSVADAPHIIVTTMFAGASGGVFILLLRGLRGRKPELPLVINGILGGLVSITASSAYVSLAVAILIGAVGSLWIILSEQILENLRIDDPVGAIPVHLGCGIWGTFAAGLFANELPRYIDDPLMRLEQVLNQILGILAINITILIFSLCFWLAIGLAICGIELVNRRLKSGAIGKDLKELNISINSDYKNLYWYLYLARRGIRVSQEEEAQGSDGSFC